MEPLYRSLIAWQRADDLFFEILRTYYDRWALRHVDEAALRRAAEDAAGAPLDWFFDQWLHRTGVVDYALRDVRVRRGDRAGAVAPQGDAQRLSHRVAERVVVLHAALSGRRP